MIADEINQFIKDNFHLDASFELNPDLSFIDSGIIDSTGILELVSFIESTFNIQVGDEDLVPDNLDSVARIVTFIERKHAGQ
jgi:acyl carrier protein